MLARKREVNGKLATKSNNYFAVRTKLHIFISIITIAALITNILIMLCTMLLIAAMTLICSVAGIFIAKLPYVNLIGALVIALLLGISLQVLPVGVREEAAPGIGFILGNFMKRSTSNNTKL
mgnify:CR=1 FL=1